MLPKEKPQEGQLFWMLILAVKCMALGSAGGSSSSSSDLHLLSPTSGTILPPALPQPDHSQGPLGPRHHPPPVSAYRSPASLRASHSKSSPCFFSPFYTGMMHSKYIIVLPQSVTVRLQTDVSWSNVKHNILNHKIMISACKVSSSQTSHCLPNLQWFYAVLSALS